MHKNHKIFLALLLSAFHISAGTRAEPMQTIEYTESISNRKTQIIWKIETSDAGTTLHSSQTELNYTTITDNSLNVIRCELKNVRAKTDVTIRRDKNILVVRGTFKGESIDKQIPIDNAPWYQPLSYCLENFARSNKKQTVYWSINPNTLKAYKMKAQKTGIEAISYMDMSIEKLNKAQKVKVNLAGPKGVFWHADYWFRFSDGLFLQYQGVDGPPGTPATFTTLHRETSKLKP